MALFDQPQWLFVGGSKHGKIECVPYAESGDTVQVPVMNTRLTLADYVRDPYGLPGPFPETFQTETYRVKKILHTTSAGLRIEIRVLVLAGGKRYISGDELHEGYLKWAVDMLLHDAGLTAVQPPRYPL